jgi:predicted short-subunit dehydrogenase-like oxidoreductase (DUF2520 family)
VAGRRPARARAVARRLGLRGAADPVAASAGAGLVLLAVPPAALREIAAALARRAGPWRGRVVLHTSGAAPDERLAPLRQAGAAVGRFHPLLPFPGRPADARRLRGAAFGVGGDARAVALGRRLARALGGRAIRVPPGRETAYHLSAVAASNLVVAVAAAAASLGPAWGATRGRALRALGPLLRAAVEDLEAAGLPRALTGPIARGEADAVAAQIRWLERHGPPSLLAAYRALGQVAVGLAVEAGWTRAAAAGRMRRLLRGARARRRTAARRPP